jgi:hypothetical protein
LRIALVPRVVSAAPILILVTALSVGCGDGDAGPGDAGPSANATAEPDPDFVREADRICTRTRQELVTLGDEVTLDTTAADPLLEPLIRPGTRILSQQADDFRELTRGTEPDEAVSTYTGYFEIIDALLNARLRVAEPNGPAEGDAQPLEARFQSMAAEQADAARAAGLQACAFDVTDAIFGS